jgi:predicted porin
MFNLGEFSMKKTLVAIAALTAVAAFAQSSVSISGGMRIGYGQNAAGAKGLMTNQGSGNTINITVVEDLGGGMAAEGAVQMRYDMTNGVLNSGLTTAPTGAGGAAAAAGAENTRLLHTTRLGLKGGFGAIQMGRIGLDQHWAYTAFGSTTAGAAVNPVGAYGATEDNQLRYVSPNISGFQAHLATSFKNNAGGAFNAGAVNGSQVFLQYANGPIAATFVNEKLNSGAKGSQLGASYNFGVAKVNFITGSIKTAGVKTADAMTLSATAPMGPVVLKAAFKNDRMAANNDANALGVDYALSKRTTVEANTWKSKLDAKRSMWVGVRHSF